MLKGTALVLALGLAAGGCSHLSTRAGGQLVSREELKNAHGYVIGTQEVTREGKRISGRLVDLRSRSSKLSLRG